MDHTVSISYVCKEFGFTARSVRNHQKKHMPLTDLHSHHHQMGLCFWMQDVLVNAIEKLEKKESYKDISSAVRAMMQLLEHLDNYSEKLYIEDTVQILKSAQWVIIQKKINETLENYPDAKKDIAIALSELTQ